MPAEVSSVERSSERGTSNARRAAQMPLLLEEARNPSRISAVVRTTAGVGSGPPEPVVCSPGARSRRKRHRYRLRRLVPVGVLVLGRRFRRRMGRRAPSGRNGHRVRDRPRHRHPCAQGRAREAAPASRGGADGAGARAERRRHRPARLPTALRTLPRHRRRRPDGKGRLGAYAHQRRRVASLTKIMTAPLVLKRLRSDASSPSAGWCRACRSFARASAPASASGVEALLHPAPLLGQRRRARARHRRGRRRGPSSAS